MGKKPDLKPTEEQFMNKYKIGYVVAALGVIGLLTWGVIIGIGSQKEQRKNAAALSKQIDQLQAVTLALVSITTNSITESESRMRGVVGGVSSNFFVALKEVTSHLELKIEEAHASSLLAATASSNYFGTRIDSIEAAHTAFVSTVTNLVTESKSDLQATIDDISSTLNSNLMALSVAAEDIAERVGSLAIDQAEINFVLTDLGIKVESLKTIPIPPAMVFTNSVSTPTPIIVIQTNISTQVTTQAVTTNVTLTVANPVQNPLTVQVTPVPAPQKIDYVGGIESKDVVKWWSPENPYGYTPEKQAAIITVVGIPDNKENARKLRAAETEFRMWDHRNPSFGHHRRHGRSWDDFVDDYANEGYYYTDTIRVRWP